MKRSCLDHLLRRTKDRPLLGLTSSFNGDHGPACEDFVVGVASFGTPPRGRVWVTDVGPLAREVPRRPDDFPCAALGRHLSGAWRFPTHKTDLLDPGGWLSCVRRNKSRSLFLNRRIFVPRKPSRSSAVRPASLPFSDSEMDPLGRDLLRYDSLRPADV